MTKPIFGSLRWRKISAESWRWASRWPFQICLDFREDSRRGPLDHIFASMRNTCTGILHRSTPFTVFRQSRRELREPESRSLAFLSSGVDWRTKSAWAIRGGRPQYPLAQARMPGSMPATQTGHTLPSTHSRHAQAQRRRCHSHDVGLMQMTMQGKGRLAIDPFPDK